MEFIYHHESATTANKQASQRHDGSLFFGVPASDVVNPDSIARCGLIDTLSKACTPELGLKKKNCLHCRHDVRVAVTNIGIAKIFIVKVFLLCRLCVVLLFYYLVIGAHRQTLQGSVSLILQFGFEQTRSLKGIVALISLRASLSYHCEIRFCFGARHEETTKPSDKNLKTTKLIYIKSSAKVYSFCLFVLLRLSMQTI